MLFESLESRQLMSVSLNATTGLLTVIGRNDYLAPDNIVVSATATTIKVSDNGVNSSYLKSKVKKVAVYARDGADNVKIDATVFLPTYLDSGNGMPGSSGDKIQGGSGPDTIIMRAEAGFGYGGAGNDRLENHKGYNLLYGQAGNDVLVTRNGGTETGYHGGTGTDTLDASAAGSGMVLRNGGIGSYIIEPDGTPWLHIGNDGAYEMENFIGTNGNDYIYGTAGSNYIDARGGNDVVRGEAGNDSLYGGAGNDNMRGGAGDDYLSGGTGADAMYGDDGNDAFHSQDGVADFLHGGLGWDKRHADAIDVINSVEAVY